MGNRHGKRSWSERTRENYAADTGNSERSPPEPDERIWKCLWSSQGHGRNAHESFRKRREYLTSKLQQQAMSCCAISCSFILCCFMFLFLSAGASWSAGPGCLALWGVVACGITHMVHGFVLSHDCYACFGRSSMASPMALLAS
jgi:hypothetical protein